MEAVGTPYNAYSYIFTAYGVLFCTNQRKLVRIIGSAMLLQVFGLERSTIDKCFFKFFVVVDEP